MEHVLHIADFRQEIFSHLDNQTLGRIACTCKAFRREARGFSKTNATVVNKILDLLEFKAQRATHARQVLEDIQCTLQWWYKYDFRETPLEALEILYEAIQSSNDVHFVTPHEFIPTMLQYLLARDQSKVYHALIDCMTCMECMDFADRHKDYCRSLATVEREDSMATYIKTLLDHGFFHVLDLESTKTYVVHNEMIVVRYLLERDTDPEWATKIENVCIALENHLVRYYERFSQRLASFRAFKRTAANIADERIGRGRSKHTLRMDDHRDDPMRSTQGMQPDAWGPALWHFMHVVSFNFPPRPTTDQQMQYFAFFKSIGFVLPCRHCRDSYQALTRDLDLNVFRSRMTLSKWLYDLHNVINAKLGKSAYDKSFDRVARKYHALRGGQPRVRSRVLLGP